MEVDTSKLTMQFDYESSEIEDIKRCLNMLYSTKAGEQPLDRDFGLKTDFLSEPILVAQNNFSLEVVRKTAKYEPRVTVQEVEYETDAETGCMIPKVYLTKGEEV